MKKYLHHAPEIAVARVCNVVYLLEIHIQGIIFQKSIVKTLLIIFLLVKTKWSYLLALRTFSAQQQCIVNHLSKKKKKKRLFLLRVRVMMKSRNKTNMKRNNLILIGL